MTDEEARVHLRGLLHGDVPTLEQHLAYLRWWLGSQYEELIELCGGCGLPTSHGREDRNGRPYLCRCEMERHYGTGLQVNVS